MPRRIPAFRDVLHRQPDQFPRGVIAIDAAGIEHHASRAQPWHFKCDFIVIDLLPVWDQFFEERSKWWDIPLAVYQFVNEAAGSLSCAAAEGFVERRVGRSHT